MTALEEQLTRALRRRVERQSGENEVLRQRVERLSADNEVLQRQIERLDGQVTRLAEYTGHPPSRDRAASVSDAPPGTGSRSGSEPLTVSGRHGRKLPRATAATMIVTQTERQPRIYGTGGVSGLEAISCPPTNRCRTDTGALAPAMRFRERQRRLVNDDRGRSFGRSRPRLVGDGSEGGSEVVACHVIWSTGLLR